MKRGLVVYTEAGRYNGCGHGWRAERIRKAFMPWGVQVDTVWFASNESGAVFPEAGLSDYMFCVFDLCPGDWKILGKNLDLVYRTATKAGVVLFGLGQDFVKATQYPVNFPGIEFLDHLFFGPFGTFENLERCHFIRSKIQPAGNVVFFSTDPAGYTKQFLELLERYQRVFMGRGEDMTVYVHPMVKIDPDQWEQKINLPMLYIHKFQFPAGDGGWDGFVKNVIGAKRVVCSGGFLRYTLALLGVPTFAIPQNEYQKMALNAMQYGCSGVKGASNSVVCSSTPAGSFSETEVVEFLTWKPFYFKPGNVSGSADKRVVWYILRRFM